MSPLRWTCKSLRRLADELSKLGHKISHTVVGELLKKQKFSLQANSETREGADNPDRDAQFRVVNEAVKTAIGENQPVISVDAKKKELVGDFKNAGREWRRQGDPEEVRVHHFLIKELGRAVPYGIYDMAANAAGSRSASTTTRPSHLVEGVQCFEVSATAKAPPSRLAALRPARACVKIARLTSAIYGMPCLRCRSIVPLSTSITPVRQLVDAWTVGAAKVTFGVPDMTLTCTSMPRWSDGNPKKVP